MALVLAMFRFLGDIAIPLGGRGIVVKAMYSCVSNYIGRWRVRGKGGRQTSVSGQTWSFLAQEKSDFASI